MIEQFHLLRPAWLLLLIPLALILWRLARSNLERGGWRQVVDEPLMPFVLTASDRHRSGWLRWVMVTVALLAIVALAGPTWEKLPQPLHHQESALVVTLDLSRSMDAADIKPSRLARARHKIADVLSRRKEGQTALVVYAADAFTVTPLTTDAATIRALLPSLESEMMPAQGSRADRAVKLAVELFANSGIGGGDILLVSDGLGELEMTRIGRLLDETPGIRLAVLAIGTAEGGPVPLADGGFLQDPNGAIVIAGMPAASLKQVAQWGDGVFATISSDDLDINALTYWLESGIDFERTRVSDRVADLWRELGPWLLLLALPLAALAFRRGLIWMLPLTVLGLPPDAQAFDWQAWWQNADQRAGRLFDQGKHAEAAEMFGNNDWRAASNYKAEEYAAALQQWQLTDSEAAQYNRGNALAKLGRYPEAIATYDALLQQNPAHQDARFNRDALADWLQRQPPQQQPGEPSSQAGEQADQAAQSQPGNQQPAEADSARQAENNAAPQPSESNRDEAGQASAAAPQPSASAAEAAAQADRAEQSAQDRQGAAAQTAQINREQQMSAQAAEQWLRKIPDDPGGLLRRKFRYQYKQRGGVEAEANAW